MRFITNRKEMNLLRSSEVKSELLNLVLSEAKKLNNNSKGKKYQLILLEKGDNIRNLYMFGMPSEINGIFALRKFQIKPINDGFLKLILIKCSICSIHTVFICEYEKFDLEFEKYFKQFI